MLSLTRTGTVGHGKTFWFYICECESTALDEVVEGFDAAFGYCSLNVSGTEMVRNV